MADLKQKYAVTTFQWDRIAKTSKLKDNGLTKAVAEFWDCQDGVCRTDDFDKGLAILPKILKLATDMKKSKEVMAAPSAAKYLTELIALVPRMRTDLANEKATFLKTGTHQVNVQIMIVDWDGKPMGGGYVASTEFSAPGAPTVQTTARLASTGLNMQGLHLRPSGTMYLVVQRAGVPVPYCEGDAKYDFKPERPLMRFKAIQFSKTVKVKARTMKEATNKLGIKGEAGFEFDVLKVGGEVADESEFKRGYDTEVEWEVEVGQKTFKDFEQL